MSNLNAVSSISPGRDVNVSRLLPLALILVSAIVGGCKTAGLFPSAPEFNYTPPPARSESRVGVNISADISSVPEILNAKAPKLIKSRRTDGLVFAAHRREDLDIKITPNLKLTARAEVAYRAAFPLLITPRCGYNVRALSSRPSLNISFATQLRMQRSYAVSLDNPSVTVTVGRPCLIGVPLGNLNPSPLIRQITEYEVMKELYPELEEIEGDLQAEYFSTIEDTWNTLSAPLTITPDVSLYLNPIEVRLQNPSFRASDFTLNSRLGLTFLPEVVVGAPGAGTAPPIRPLPLARLGGSIPSDHFEFYAPALVNLDFVESQLADDLKAVLSQDIRLGPVRLKFEVQDVEFRAYGDKIVMKIEYEASRVFGSGWLYVFGTPSYHPSTNLLTFPDLDFTVETGNLITRLVTSTGRTRLIELIRDNTEIDLSGVETSLKQQIENALDINQGGVRLTGNVASFEFRDVRTAVERNAIAVLFLTRGSMSLTIPPIEHEISDRTIQRLEVHADILEEDKDPECGFDIFMEKDDARCKIANGWGAGSLWQDFRQFETTSQCFNGEPVTANYEMNLQIVRSTASRCSGLDVEVELYVLIKDDEDNTYLSPVTYVSIINGRSGTTRSMGSFRIE